MEEIDSLRPIGSFLLLGDILDLTMSLGTSAWSEASQFFRDISCILKGTEIYYLPGNHDHHIWSLLIEEEYIVSRLLQAREEDTIAVLKEPTFTDLKFDSDSFVHGIFPEAMRDYVQIRYPFVWLDCGGRSIAFHHGHYFDPTITPIAQHVAEKYRANTVERVEECNFAWLEGLFYYSSLGRTSSEFLTKSYFYYRLIEDSVAAVCKALGMRTDKMKEIGTALTVKRIRNMMNCLYGRNSYVLVFGHTHRSGSYRTPEGTIEMYNTGGWLVERMETGTPHVSPAIFHAHAGVCEVKAFRIEDDEKREAAEKSQNVFPLR